MGFVAGTFVVLCFVPHKTVVSSVFTCSDGSDEVMDISRRSSGRSPSFFLFCLFSSFSWWFDISLRDFACKSQTIEKLKNTRRSGDFVFVLRATNCVVVTRAEQELVARYHPNITVVAGSRTGATVCPVTTQTLPCNTAVYISRQETNYRGAQLPSKKYRELPWWPVTVPNVTKLNNRCREEP